MNESSLERRWIPFRELVAGIVVILVLGISCSSTSQTNVTASQGGSAGIGGSGTAAGGSSSASTTSGGTGNTDCSAGATLAPDLHAACIEDLGQGRVRIRYDFATADQALDWAASTEATVSVNQRALTVAAYDTIGVAIFKKKLHVDKASFTVTLLSGTTTNWYINTIWSGSWNPDAGFAGYHDNTGRGFIINGTKYAAAVTSPLSVGGLHDAAIEQSDTELKWDQDGDVMTEAVGPLPVTDRSFALGAWQASAAYYDVVFEGTLN